MPESFFVCAGPSQGYSCSFNFWPMLVNTAKSCPSIHFLQTNHVPSSKLLLLLSSLPKRHSLRVLEPQPCHWCGFKWLIPHADGQRAATPWSVWRMGYSWFRMTSVDFYLIGHASFRTGITAPDPVSTKQPISGNVYLVRK